MKKNKITIIGSVIILLGLTCTLISFSSKDKSIRNNINDIKNINNSSNHDEVPSDEILLMLVNYENKVPDNYKPILTEYEDYEFSVYLEKDFKEMIKDAKENGYNIEISSAYRSNSEQKQIYDEKYKSYIEMGMDKEEAKQFTEKEVAVPGYSEHETGLAIDLSTMGDLDEREEAWNYLKNNSYKYGFINRYPEDKLEITKIKSEPWHFRYVGKKYAKEIYDAKVCLEEYLHK